MAVPESPSSSPVEAGARSIVHAFWADVERLGNRAALRRRVGHDWEAVSWRDYGELVEAVAAGLIAAGVERGDRVAILSNNRVEWHVSDLAAMSIGAVTVPIYQTSSSSQVQYALDMPGVKICVIEDREQLDKILTERSSLPELQQVVLMEGRGRHDDEFVVGWDLFCDYGRKLLVDQPDAVRERVDLIQPDDLATLVYTSGTTGNPKGAMITHRNISATIAAVVELVGISPTDRFVSFLPLSHIAERMVSHFCQITAGGETWFARSLATVAEDLHDCHPTVFFAVPRVWEKLREAIEEQVSRQRLVERLAARSYISLGLASVPLVDGPKPAPWTRFTHKVADRAVGRVIRAKLGLDRARILVSAAAPISPDLLRWFHGIGLPIAEVYGQTEDCGPATLNPIDAIRIGTVGRPLPGVEISIASDGEILVRGDTVCAGYFEDDAATRALIDDDGWMHTGDVGRFDAAGYLMITDRKKDLIITAAGQNVAPQQIETRLRGEPLIGQPVVVGDRRRYLTALITLDQQELSAWAERHHKLFTPEALAGDPDVRAEVAAAVERVNAEHARVEGIKKFRILPHEFTTAGGELTPTLKIRRKVVCEKYGALIEEMYAEDEAGLLGQESAGSR